MPRRDGTGPDGTGANTGRGMGPCNGSKDSERLGLGRRGGRSCGRRGRCRWDGNDNSVTSEN